jgi:hypothetical protein
MIIIETSHREWSFLNCFLCWLDTGEYVENWNEYLIVNFFCPRHRIPKNQWWLKLRPLLRILAKHESAYEEEGMYMTVEDTNVAEGVI